MSLPERRTPLRAFGCLLSGFLALLVFSCSLCIVRSPNWWKAGRPRKKPDSIADLAVLLLPEEPIEELFAERGMGPQHLES